MNEAWRSIHGFPGYQVSDLGRVRSFKSGELLGSLILKPSRGGGAKRAIVTLYRDAVPHYRLVARLVCRAFHGEPMDGQQAAHGDGDVFNDRADNLRWATASENSADRDRHGRTSRGARHYAAKLSDGDVRSIRAAYETAKSAGRVYGVVTGLAKRHGVAVSCIEDIVYGRKWRSVA